MYVAWPTHNRSESLLRSIHSLKKLRGRIKFVVSNSGKTDVAHAADTDAWEGERRQDWIEKLNKKAIEVGIDPELISFAINPEMGKNSKVISTGANRNFLLLNLVGKKFISVDDDVIFETYKINSEHNRNFIPANEFNHLSTFYFNNKEELKIFKENMTPVDLSDFFQTHLLMLQYEKEGRRCGLSLAGYFGDSGFQSPRSIFSFDESSIEHLVKDHSTLDTALKSRILWRVSDTKKLMETSIVMPICAGFSNDLELPPFFPLGRNQDGAYGYAMSACLDSVFIGHMDIAICHEPLDIRSYDQEFSPLQIRVNDLIALLWIELLNKKNKKSYTTASVHFKEFSEQENFAESIQLIVSDHFIKRAETLDAKINNLKKKSDIYNLWIQLAEKEKEACIISSQNISYMIPIEAISSTDNQLQAILLTKKWIGLYGQLLGSWTAIRQIAQKSL